MYVLYVYVYCKHIYIYRTTCMCECKLIPSIAPAHLEDDLIAIAPGGACDHNIERCFRASD